MRVEEFEKAVVVLQTGHNQAFRAHFEQIARALLLDVRIVIRGGDDQRVAARDQGIFDGVNEGGEDRTFQRRDDRANGVVAAGDQCPGRGVGGIADALRRFEHDGLGLGGDLVAVVEGPRNGRQ